MAESIRMPLMGMYTEEGTLTTWLRQAGARVQVGEAIAEVSTDKITFEVPAPVAGFLQPLATVGTTLKVEAVMGYILSDGEEQPSGPNGETGLVDREQPQVRPFVPRDQPSLAAPSPASPAARRLAAEYGIDISGVKGTGPGGRIVEADIKALRSHPAGGKMSDSEVDYE